MDRPGIPGGYQSRRVLKIEADESFIIDGRRTWHAHSTKNGHEPRPLVIRDPQLAETYLQHDASLHSENIAEASETVDSLTRARRVRAYCNTLANQLGLPEASDENEANEDAEKNGTLEIHVSDRYTDRGFSIHSLLWELLEHQEYTKYSGTSIHIVHTIGVENSRSQNDPLSWNPSSNRPPRILLVVSRSWQNTRGYFTDLSPTLVQDTLCYLSEILRQEGRPFIFHVVRPGTIDSLEQHLEIATASGEAYDIIHFDLHGRIAPNNEPELLQRHRIPFVALNACNSAYAQTGHASNLCLRLIENGVEAVTGMNFAIRGTAARLYFQGFYTSLLFAGNSFEIAAAEGREFVREHYPEPLRELEHEPSALPLVYRTAIIPVQTAVGPTMFQRCLHFLPLWDWFVLVSYASVCNLPYVEAQWNVLGKLLQWTIALGSILATSIIYSRDSIDVSNIYRRLFRPRRSASDQHIVLENLRVNSPSALQGVGMMAVDDQLRLKDEHAVMIEQANPFLSPQEDSHLKSVFDTRQMTGFVNDLTIVEGDELFSPLWYWRSLLKYKLSSFREPSTRPSMIVFRDFHVLFDKSTSLDVRNRALRRITQLRENVFKTKDLYYVFIGHNVPWQNGEIDPDEHPWVVGTVFYASTHQVICSKN